MAPGPSSPPPAGRRRRLDVLVEVAVVVLTALPTVPDGWTDRLRVLPVLLVLAMVVPLPARRSHPVAVFLVVLGATTVGLFVPASVVAGPAVLVALYSVARYATRRAALAAGAALELVVLLALWRLEVDQPLYGAVFISGTGVGALALGLYQRTRQAYLVELHERVERLERERSAEVALATAEERRRIAREMHDVVAHHLTVMVALSDGAAAASLRTPERAGEVMRTVSATGRRALADTRRLLGVLRDDLSPDDAPPPPAPDLGDLDALVERVRAAGLPVSHRVTGSTEGLPEGLQLTVFRLAQEALTNVLKHAGPGARAAVRLTVGPSEVHLDVDDEGGRGAPDAVAGRPGRGLTGMRERAAASGGQVLAGPTPSGGWRVRARLPLEPGMPVPVLAPEVPAARTDPSALPTVRPAEGGAP